MAIFWSIVAALSISVSVYAQSTPSQGSASNSLALPTPSQSGSQSAGSQSLVASLSLTTANVTVTTTTLSGTSSIQTVVVVPTVFNVTRLVAPTPTSDLNSSAAASASASATPTPEPIHLDTKVDGAFGTLGAILILTGLPSAFWGHKNRWTSFFLIGFYTLSLVCLVLILKFGVIPAINPPNATLRGLFVLACCVAGVAGGGVSIFFWKASKYFIGAWGGLAFAWWLQCFRDGGLIGPIGFRWIMYTACAVVGWVLCTIPKFHYYVLLLSTAMVGATSLMLGVDCYTTAGLKEFYIWNVGFMVIFPKFTENGIRFPVSQTMQIELGLMGAAALMGAAVQFQVLKILQRKLREIKEEQKRQDEATEALAAERFATLDKEKEDWALAHPGLEHGRNESAMTSTTLGGLDEKSSLLSPRARYLSGVSDFIPAPRDSEELNRATSRVLQTPGVLPPLDLGADIEHDVPQNYIADKPREERSHSPEVTMQELEDLKKKSQLLQEIETIRKSIDWLKSDSSETTESRRQSLTSRRTLSQNLSSFTPAGPSHLRPPRSTDPRIRAHSMDLTRVGEGASISRPSSIPLEEDWDTYVRDRKLLQPPSGITAPIPTTAVPFGTSTSPRAAVSPAVQEALAMRQRRESSLSFGGINPLIQESDSPTPEPSSTGDGTAIPRLRGRKDEQTHASHGANVTILPPRKAVVSPTAAPKPEGPRTKTYEELAERHREKMREMQAPVTKAEKEQATLLAAKERWERAKEKEKVDTSKRRAEKAAAISKEAKKKTKGPEASGGEGDSPQARGRTTGRQEPGGRHSRSLSAELLSALPRGTTSSSKRASQMKVENWQRNQLEEPAKPSNVRQGSMSNRQSAVPFPDTGTQSRRHPGGPRRDPTS